MSESSSHDADASAANAATEAKQLVLIKKGQRYVFRYEEGQESKLLAHLAEMVQRGDSDLDWFDAAVLSHQMGQRLSSQLQRYIRPPRNE